MVFTISVWKPGRGGDCFSCTISQICPPDLSRPGHKGGIATDTIWKRGNRVGEGDYFRWYTIPKPSPARP